MVSVLLTAYIGVLKKHKICAGVFALIFGFIEVIFFLSCCSKFFHGGYVAILIALLIFLVMLIWHLGTQVERMQSTRLKLSDYIPKLDNLRHDKHVPKTASNIVFLTASKYKNYIEQDILYSILDKKVKRAEAYWFVNIHTTTQPFGGKYSVETFGTDFIYRVTIHLGFKEDQRLNVFMTQIFNDLLTSAELKPQKPKHTIYSEASRKRLKRYYPINLGSVVYCLIHKTLIPESDLSDIQKWAVSWKYRIRTYAGSPARWYGLENSSLLIESVPLFLDKKNLDEPLKRIK